jgi:soluble lytic murein transglycosylase
MSRYLVSCLLILVVIAVPGAYFFNDFWIHRFDPLIQRQAAVYRLDDKLVWSVIYEETYFRPWKIGAAEEVGLMQVTPTVARLWAKETGLKEFERQTSDNLVEFLRDPERNIQVGSWYLEKVREQYRGLPAETAMSLAAYNAGPSRVDEWKNGNNLISENEFIDRIGIASTKSYVSSILDRYRRTTVKVTPEEQK